MTHINTTHKALATGYLPGPGLANRARHASRSLRAVIRARRLDHSRAGTLLRKLDAYRREGAADGVRMFFQMYGEAVRSVAGGMA